MIRKEGNEGRERKAKARTQQLRSIVILRIRWCRGVGVTENEDIHTCAPLFLSTDPTIGLLSPIFRLAQRQKTFVNKYLSLLPPSPLSLSLVRLTSAPHIPAPYPDVSCHVSVNPLTPSARQPIASSSTENAIAAIPESFPHL